MALKSFLGDALPQAIGASTGALKDKINEGASKLASTNGGWGGAKKLLADGRDKTRTAADWVTGKKKLTDQGLSPAQAEEALRRMSPPGEGTNLDSLQADLTLASIVDTEITAAQLKRTVGAGAADDSIAHKVKLVEKGVDEVIFEIMPEVVESRTVEYEAVAPPQHPAAFQKYRGTSSTQWTVNATLTCRNTEEATENLRIINVLRGWTMPFFGAKTAATYPNKLGAPPPVLEFSGWRNQMVGPVQVVITSLNWNFPQDVDYIPAEGFDRNLDSAGPRLERNGQLIPFPTVIKIAIQLVESFSTDQLNGFDLAEFRTGRFDRAFAQTLSLALETGRRSPTGLSAGGAVAPEEAQRVAGNPLSAADRAALNAADEFAPVTEVPIATTVVASVPPTVPPVAANQEQRRQLAAQIRVIDDSIQIFRSQFDTNIAEAIKQVNLGNMATAAFHEGQADIFQRRVVELVAERNALQSQYDALNTDGA